MGICGPFDLMPNQKTMQTRCLCVFYVMWVPKPRNWHFWSFRARPCRLIWCPVVGCGAWAVSRKTPIYFLVSRLFVSFFFKYFECVYMMHCVQSVYVLNIFSVAASHPNTYSLPLLKNQGTTYCSAAMK